MLISGIAFAILQILSTNSNPQTKQQQKVPFYSGEMQDSDKGKRCVQHASSILELLKKNTDLAVSDMQVAVEDDEYAACIANYLSNATKRRYTIIKGLDNKYRVVEYLEKYF